jgi:hypothetical protein
LGGHAAGRLLVLPGLPEASSSTDKTTLYAGPLKLTHEARTCRVVIRDKAKKVVHCTGAGPDQYHIKKVLEFLAWSLRRSSIYRCPTSKETRSPMSKRVEHDTQS